MSVDIQNELFLSPCCRSEMLCLRALNEEVL